MTRHISRHGQLDERTSALIGDWCHCGFCKLTVEPIPRWSFECVCCVGTDDRLTILLYERPPQATSCAGGSPTIVCPS